MACFTVVGATAAEAPTAAAAVEAAKAAFARQDYKSGIPLVRRWAENGNAAAQYLMREAALGNYGGPRNEAEALRWYRKAAHLGNADAARAAATVLRALPLR
jgi:TPR repeat protein